MSYGRKEYRLFGLLLWSVDHLPYEGDEVEEDEELPGDHNGGQFEFGFSQPGTLRLEPGLTPPPEAW